MELSSKSLSRGVGGSYTKWQREPPAHKVYQIETPQGKVVVTVYAENRALDDEDYPTIQRIENANDFASDIDWNNLDADAQTEIREHLAEKVRTDEWFADSD